MLRGCVRTATPVRVKPGSRSSVARGVDPQAATRFDPWSCSGLRERPRASSMDEPHRHPIGSGAIRRTRRTHTPRGPPREVVSEAPHALNLAVDAPQGGPLSRGRRTCQVSVSRPSVQRLSAECRSAACVATTEHHLARRGPHHDSESCPRPVAPAGLRTRSPRHAGRRPSRGEPDRHREEDAQRASLRIGSFHALVPAITRHRVTAPDDEGDPTGDISTQCLQAPPKSPRRWKTRGRDWPTAARCSGSPSGYRWSNRSCS